MKFDQTMDKPLNAEMKEQVTFLGPCQCNNCAGNGDIIGYFDNGDKISFTYGGNCDQWIDINTDRYKILDLR